MANSDHKQLQAIFIHSAPCRIQRMLLRLLCYNLSVSCKKRSQVFLADHLSSATIAKEKQDEDADEFQVFAAELEKLNPFDAIKLSSET